MLRGKRAPHGADRPQSAPADTSHRDTSSRGERDVELARAHRARQRPRLPAQAGTGGRRSAARAGALEPPASVVVSRRCLRRLGVLQKSGSVGLPVWRRASRWVPRFIGACEGVSPPRLPVLSSEHESTIVSSPISPTSSAPCRVARCSRGRSSPFLSPKGFPRRTYIVICAPPWIDGRCNTLGFEPRSGTEAPTSAVVARLLGRMARAKRSVGVYLRHSGVDAHSAPRLIGGPIERRGKDGSGSMGEPGRSPLPVAARLLGAEAPRTPLRRREPHEGSLGLRL